MKIKYFYDTLCPYSWLGYQIIKMKLPKWREIGPVKVEYLPFMWPKVYKTVASHTIDDISTAKAKYVQQDLKDIAGYYHLKHGNFQRMYDRTIRSNSCLWFLNLVRKEEPEFYENFMEAFWERLYLKNETVNCANDILKVCRELELPFKKAQKLTMHTESRPNVEELIATRNFMVEKVKATGSPVMLVNLHGWDLQFIDIMKLELIDEIFTDPDLIPDHAKFARISALM